jgi:hypothetical protein
MANVVEGEPRNSQEWFGSYIDEDGVVADILKRVTADDVAVKRWLDPQSWYMPNVRFSLGGLAVDEVPEGAGSLMFAPMAIRNFYGMWHADNPHTEVEDLETTDGIVTDPRHPDNFSGRVIRRVKEELKRLYPEPKTA